MLAQLDQSCYLRSYYETEMENRTEDMVSVPIQMIETANIDQKDVGRILHALLLMQEASLDPLRLSYPKNQLISHYFRDL